MSQTKTPESKTGKNPRVSKDEKKHLCHIHDKVESWYVDGIRQNVCVNDEDLTEHTDGKYYCLFHLPEAEGKKEKFEKKFKERIQKIEESIKDSEKKDEETTTPSKEGLNYDFSYVYFPAKVNFFGYNFKTSADFFSATFTAAAYFSAATFTAAAYFSSATFTAAADFSSATFTSNAYFSSATFTENSQTFFDQTKFCSLVVFYRTEFNGFVEFEGDVFLTADRVREIDDELNIERESREAFLVLSQARLNKPERISFNSMKLRPCWFVNAEVRNLVFNDVEWLNLDIDIDRSGLTKEFKALRKRKVRRIRQTLIKTFNQLGDNAEANRRIEEARLHHKQSIAINKYKCHIHEETDKGKKDNIRRNVCKKYPVVNEDGGNYYCLWHNPATHKAEVFLREFEKRQAAGHTDFRSVVFPVAVEYTGDIPDNLNFSGATFRRRVVFEKAKIKNLDFSEANFTAISKLVFKDSRCYGKINLDNANIEGKVFFNGKAGREFFKNQDKALSLKDARIEKPHWINFRSINILPHYFVDVDASKFFFHDCKWRNWDESEFELKTELESATHKDLAQTCNQLAINYEENRHYDESSNFRYAAMEAKRLGYKSTFTRIFNLYWLYKWTSGYGESRLWATGVLVFLIGLFSIFYATHFASFDYGSNPPKPAETFVGNICDKMRIRRNPNGMTVCDGIVHSLAVASFQRPDPKPADSLTKFFVTLETILVPLQAALLALAIRRKFMR